MSIKGIKLSLWNFLLRLVLCVFHLLLSIVSLLVCINYVLINLPQIGDRLYMLLLLIVQKNVILPLVSTIG